MLAGRRRESVDALARALGLEARAFGLDDVLDITGEIAVFEQAQSLDARAQDAGIVLCPGVGFDSRSGFSPGTARTSVEGLAQGGKVRRNGTIITVPLAYEVRRIDFGDGAKEAMTIPWGDVSTACTPPACRTSRRSFRGRPA